MINATAQTRKIVATLIASVLMDFLGFGIIFPLLPFYSKVFGASPLEIGVLMGLSPLMGIFAPTIWGRMSDRIGRRPAFLFNIGGTILAFLWLSLANSLAMLFISQILTGASSASIVIAQSYLLDLTTAENRTKTLSILEAAAGIGLVIGPALGGLLVGSDPVHPNFRLPGLAAAIASVLTFCLAYLALPKLGGKPGGRTPSSTVLPRFSPQQFCLDIQGTLKRPLVGPVLILVFVGIFANMGVEAIFALWCETRFGWGPQQFGYFVILYCLAIAIIQIIVTGQLARWLGEIKLLWLSFSAGVLGFVLIPFSTTLLQLAGAALFIIFSTATSAPVFASLLSHLSGVKQQGKTLGLMRSVTGLGRFLGAIGAGFIFGMLGPDWPYWLSGLLMLSGALFCRLNVTQSQLRAVKRRRRQQKLIYFFNILDRDQNGTLENIDFQHAGRRLAQLRGWAHGTTEYETLQASLIGFGEMLQALADQNGNQRIDRAEWLHSLDQWIDDDFADFFFQIIDANQDGQVVFDELRTFYQAYDICIGDLDEVFHTLDLNQDGHISKEEFKTLFTQFLRSDDVQSPGNWILGARLPRQL